MNISFKSLYAIPHDKVQNPLNKNYNDFMTQTANLRDSDKKSKYDIEKDIYYVYVRDEHDKKFEDCALSYGIKYNRVNSMNLENVCNIIPKTTPADKELAFLTKAIKLGGMHNVAKNGNVKEVSLFDDSTKDIFAKYYINNDKLTKKIEYIDGKIDCIHEYDENGQFKRSEIYRKNGNIVFTYDEQGKPKIQI